MLGDSLDRYEDLIDAELSFYQTQLDHGLVSADDAVRAAPIPVELQRDLDDFRDCLDLISRERKKSQESVSTAEADGSNAASEDLAPLSIGRFEIAEQLGVGGFGIVFRGFDPVMRRDVAIKIPRPEFIGSQELTDRFASEAAAVAQLEHPNIVPIYESDCLEIVPYIVMPFVHGKTLAQWRSGVSDVSPRMAAEIVRLLANAVAHAHERGVLHRDLKPSNVLLANCDEGAVGNGLGFIPRLTDFGLAKCTNSIGAETRTGSMLGTVSYMSPEQVEGRIRDVTSRSDIYGLGGILYELLNGTPPFHDVNQLRTIQKILRDEPPSLQSRHTRIPIDLEVICLKCLEKSPAKRYPSANALADDLQRFLNYEPIEARPIQVMARVGKWSKRNPALATSSAAIVLCLLVIAGVALRYNGLLNSFQNVAEVERRNRHQTAMIAKRRAYVLDMRNAKIIGDHHDTRQMLKLLERYGPKSAEPDFRDFVWWNLTREYEESSSVLGTHGNGATAVAMSRDGRLAASCGMDGTIRIWALPDGKMISTLNGHQTGAVESVDFSPDARRLVSAGDDGTVRIWDLTSCNQVFVSEGHNAHVLDVMYSPEGDVIASCGADHQVRLWDPATGEQIGMLSGHTDSVNCLTFHPFQPLLVSGGKDSKVCFWDWKNRCTEKQIDGGLIQLPSLNQWPRSLVFSPDGQSLDVGVSNAMVLRYSLENGQYGKEVHRRSLNGIPNCLAWPPNGALITALGNSQIHVADQFDPSLPGELKRGHQGPVVSVAVTEDGASMVSAAADGEIRYWPDYQKFSRINVARDKGVDWIDEHGAHELQWRENYLAVDFQQQEVALYRMPEKKLAQIFSKTNDAGFVLSPSGKLLLIFQMNGTVQCFRTDSEQPVWTLELPPRTQPFFTEFSAINTDDVHAIVAWEKELIVLSMQSPEILRRFVHPDRVWQVTFTEDEHRLPVPISACDDGFIRFWHLGYARVENMLRANSGPTYTIAVSNDRKFLATAGDDYSVRIWRYPSLEPIAVLPSSEPPGPSRMVFLQGFAGSNILARQNIHLSLWGVQDEAELLVFPECGQFGSLAVSPDGKQLAVSQQRSVRLIDGREKRPLPDLAAH